MPRSKVLLTLSLATLFVPAFGQGAHQAGPGTLNYVEGNASIDGRAVTSQSVGYAGLDAGGTLATANGKVEVLLTPGVFLRVGEDSTIQMISTNLTHTEVQIQRGRAEVEVDQIFPQNHLQIDLKNGQALLLKNGLYEFNADNGSMRVFNGKAAAFEGTGPANQANTILVKGSHELTLNGDPVKPAKFDKNNRDELYQWSGLRSEYLGEANEDLAENYVGAYGGGPYAAGWLWDSDLYGYTWLPGDGAFLSPFGYGFYSPYYLYGGGFFYGRGFGYRGGGYGGFRGGYGGGGFRGGGAGFHGGGGGGGGAHGGGGGGGHR